MSKSRHKTRAQKIKSQHRRLSTSTNQTSLASAIPVLENPTPFLSDNIAVTHSSGNKIIENLYAYPVNLIKADMFKSLIISGFLMAGLGVIAWKW